MPHYPVNRDFNICDYLDKLTPAKEKDKYNCPVCGGHNLGINKKTGEYNCFNGCDTKAIARILTQDERLQGRLPYPMSTKTRGSKKPKNQLQVDPQKIELATFKKKPLLPGRETRNGQYGLTHVYSHTQVAIRLEDPNTGKKVGFYQKCQIDGKWENKKGNQPWPLYCESDLELAIGKWILWVEGENCVDHVRSHLGFVATTFLGSESNSDTHISRHLNTIKEAGIKGIVVWPDHDKTGYDKASKIEACAAGIGLPVIVLDPVAIYPEIDEKWDVVDVLGAGMRGDDLIELIYKQIREYNYNVVEIGPSKQDLDELLRLEIQSLLLESDPIRRVRRRAEVCSYFRLSKQEVDELMAAISKRSTQPAVSVMSIDALLSMESTQLDWLIPEFLPRGETVILAGPPKTGKTLLAIDAAFAVATGESEFLGTQCHKGRVLLISADESPTSTRTKVLKRGFRFGDQVDIFKNNWSIDQLLDLEKILDENRYSLVIVDSLKRVTAGSLISENSSEFADKIYQLKELFQKYNTSAILIHHTNKSQEATGVHKIRGSSAIAGAVWGTWQLEQKPKINPDNKKQSTVDPSDPIRQLSVYARDTEGQLLNIEFNPDNNSWIRLSNGEVEAEGKTLGDRIIDLLSKNAPLSGREVSELLGENGNRSVYNALNRLLNKRLISARPSTKDKRVMLYCLDNGPVDVVAPIVKTSTEAPKTEVKAPIVKTSTEAPKTEVKPPIVKTSTEAPKTEVKPPMVKTVEVNLTPTQISYEERFEALGKTKFKLNEEWVFGLTDHSQERVVFESNEIWFELSFEAIKILCKA